MESYQILVFALAIENILLLMRKRFHSNYNFSGDNKENAAQNSNKSRACCEIYSPCESGFAGRNASVVVVIITFVFLNIPLYH